MVLLPDILSRTDACLNSMRRQCANSIMLYLEASFPYALDSFLASRDRYQLIDGAWEGLASSSILIPRLAFDGLGVLLFPVGNGRAVDPRDE